MSYGGTGAALADFDSFDRFHWLAVALALFTAMIHLFLGIMLLGQDVPARLGDVGLPVSFGVLFVVAGLGYLVGTVVFLSRYWRRGFYLLSAVYAAVMVVWWLANGMPSLRFGGPDKIAQVLLVVVSLYLFRTDGR